MLNLRRERKSLNVFLALLLRNSERRNKAPWRVMTHTTYLPSSIDLSHKSLASLWPLSCICIYWAIPGKAVPCMRCQVLNPSVKSSEQIWKTEATRPMWQLCGEKKICAWLKEQGRGQGGGEKKGRDLQHLGWRTGTLCCKFLQVSYNSGRGTNMGKALV